MTPIPKNVLITGGTGTFGQAFTRHLLELHDVERVCIYSRDEHKQALMRATLKDDPRLRWFVGDVRDLPRLTQAMDGCELVVHAAALKRVEVGEYNPTEMVKTNVLGAMNIVQAATDAPGGYSSARGPRKVVSLSTDKACAPTNAYGATKLVMEKLMLAAGNTVGRDGPRFALSRYGNIAGSNGSVIPTWRRALANGEPLRITAPEATRFWMTAKQAVDLVVWTAQNMMGGEIVVPDLPAYRLQTLLGALTDGDEHPVRIHVTQLGPGEKLHETMISEHEAPNFWLVNDYWVGQPQTWVTPNGLPQCIAPLTSDRAKRMDPEWLKRELEELP